MLHAVSANFIFDAILNLFAAIDSMIYSLISLLSGLLISISEIRLSDTLIADFSSRIFVILGILMLFKLTMSLINVVINPEALTDKQEGTGKIVSRIVIMLVMLLSVNWVFSFAMQAQGGIVRTIPKLLLGTSDTLEGYSPSEIENGDYKNSSTEQIAALSFKAFVTPNGNCDDSPYIPFWKEAETISSVTELVTAVCSNDHSLYVFDYNFGISTIAGIFLVFVLIGFCVDIAVRVIKLAILQMLAPIPIISYADPKTSKKSFDNWIKMCVSAYVELFIKLAIIYFAIFLLGQITSSSAFVTADGEPISGWLMVLLVIAIFFFAKQAPQYIADIFGVKLDSSGSFFGKIAGMAAAGVGAGLGIVGGMALGGALGTAGGFTQGLIQGGGIRSASRMALAGMAGGAAEGTKGLKAGAHQFRNQSNEAARALTGDAKYETGFGGMLRRNATTGLKLNQQRAQYHYDNKWKQKDADRRIAKGYSYSGTALSGKFAEDSDAFHAVARNLLQNDKNFQQLELKRQAAIASNDSAEATNYLNQMTAEVESLMTDPTSDFYNASFARKINNRDKYSARANASVERDKAKAAQDTQKQMEAVLKKMGYDKK